MLMWGTHPSTTSINEGDRIDLFTKTVNWLNCLNCEAIERRLIGCNQFVQGASYGQTVIYYIWCDRLPCAVPVVRSSVYVTIGRFVCMYILTYAINIATGTPIGSWQYSYLALEGVRLYKSGGHLELAGRGNSPCQGQGMWKNENLWILVAYP